ncbi:ComEA family DNA-binding protein [Streptomyces sp. DSM 44917]|uniref:ComEA family DNA-binding protein n=1 Tax=Streptomyces boetiae TaxID=3075541 RepID=A0ABU2L7K0_9ACTN|nr:ComEA family DNA-binding protein [Streptomyces sp. DSM 44917]MDT0307485.1 ComEA family DNA-binding protein [Streptomyces sp. DSM 44917]
METTRLRGPGRAPGPRGPGRTPSRRRLPPRTRARATTLFPLPDPVPPPPGGGGTGPGREPADPPPPKGAERSAPAEVPAAPGPLPWGRRVRLAVGERVRVERRAVAALCLVLLVAAGFGVQHLWAARPRAVPAVEPAAATAEAVVAEAARPPGKVVVDVAGDVGEPGIYTLPSGSRVADAIEAAGGSDPDADTTGLNRARVLADGEQIVVGTPPAAPGPAGAPAAQPAPGGEPRLSLNAATAAQLETLPGIGPVLAGHILAHRERHGPFTSVEQLGEVTGIGERRLAELRDRVTL